MPLASIRSRWHPFVVVGKETTMKRRKPVTLLDVIKDDPTPRCPTCGSALGDPGLVEVGYCTSECEREARY